jgi:hypothetical protein
MRLEDTNDCINGNLGFAGRSDTLFPGDAITAGTNPVGSFHPQTNVKINEATSIEQRDGQK